MPRKSDFDVTLEKAGFKTWKGHVTHHVAASGGAGFVGNALVGGVIGAGVDVASGAMMDLVPNPLNVVLEKVDDPVPPLAPAAAPPPTPADPAK